MIEAAKWFALVGKLFATISFTVIYKYTTELYPTLARYGSQVFACIS